MRRRELTPEILCNDQSCCTNVLLARHRKRSNSTGQLYARIHRESAFRVPYRLTRGKAEQHHQKHKNRNSKRDASMTKKQTVGLVFMLGSAAAAIQLTIFFSMLLRGWAYSICLGMLVIAFAGGADMFRGKE